MFAFFFTAEGQKNLRRLFPPLGPQNFRKTAKINYHPKLYEQRSVRRRAQEDARVLELGRHDPVRQIRDLSEEANHEGLPARAASKQDHLLLPRAALASDGLDGLPLLHSRLRRLQHCAEKLVQSSTCFRDIFRDLGRDEHLAVQEPI